MACCEVTCYEVSEACCHGCSEQMSAIEARTDAEAGEAHVGGKRKAGGKGAAGARKNGPGAVALSTHVRLLLL